MKELIEELKLNRVAYLLEIMEKKDFDSKINALKKLEKMKITPNIGLFLIQNSTKNYGVNDNNGGLNASILSLCFKNYYDVYTDAIEKVYKNLLPNVQNKVVYLQKIHIMTAEQYLLNNRVERKNRIGGKRI